MAGLLDVGFFIDRRSFPVGSICTVSYHYELDCDPIEIENSTQYSIWCEIWGKERLGDKLLIGALDSHNQKASAGLRQSRNFIIPCEILDDRLGLDKIFLIVKARSSFGERIETSTALIEEHF